MDKAQRAELIRKRFKAKGGILPLRLSPERVAVATARKTPARGRTIPFGEASLSVGKQWLREPDPVPRVTVAAGPSAKGQVSDNADRR